MPNKIITNTDGKPVGTATQPVSVDDAIVGYVITPASKTVAARIIGVPLHLVSKVPEARVVDNRAASYAYLQGSLEDVLALADTDVNGAAFQNTVREIAASLTASKAPVSTVTTVEALVAALAPSADEFDVQVLG